MLDADNYIFSLKEAIESKILCRQDCFNMPITNSGHAVAWMHGLAEYPGLNAEI